MNSARRFAVFLAVILISWSLMHLFVFIRLASLPLLTTPAAGRWTTAVFAVLCSFPVAQVLARRAGHAALPLDLLASIWVGLLFLLFVALLAADVATGFGWLLPRAVPLARSAAAGVAIVLAAVALVQGARPPVVHGHEVAIDDLRPEDDGLVLVQITDLHLGELLGRRWLESRVAQVNALHPDIILMTGDLLNAVSPVEALVPVLRRLKAPLGVYAVTGNHEYYAGVGPSVRLFEDAGFRVLRNAAVEAKPGLVLAGVDDLTAARQFDVRNGAIERALAGRPAGATVFLSHTPWGGDEAARHGVALMLSGHTHGGQIWPFTYLVRLFYPHLVGRYTIGGMTWIVSRGTGFWGPPMRLFRRAEVLRIRLRRRTA